MAAIAGATASDRWLFGRWLDLLVGCGLGYVVLVPILFGFVYATGVQIWPIGAVVAFTTLINSPHYGATVLRVYESREGRAKYRFFAVYVTLAVALLGAAASHSAWLASLVITIYLTWSPWHFAGQNYGLALMFLRRRGVEVDALTKRLFYLSFVFSAALAMLAIHGLAIGGESQLFSISQTTLSLPGAPKLITIGIPMEALRWLFPVALIGYAGCLAAFAWRLRGRGSGLDQAPAWTLVSTQALWFLVPALTGDQRLPFAAVWIATAHALQYLWITAYYAKQSPAREPAGRYLWKTLVAGLAVTNLPILLFAPDLLGGFPWDVGLAMTAFSIVNIHHFILDGAIWKLRDGSIARVLLRPSTAPEAGSPSRARGSKLGAVIWGVAGLSLVVQALVAYGLLEISRDPTPERAAEVQRRLRWLGRESVGLHLEAAHVSEQEGDDQSAIDLFRRSIELFPNAEGWEGLGRVYVRRSQFELSLDAYEHAAALEPESPRLLFRRAQVRLALAENGTRPDPGMQETIGVLRRVLELRPDHAPASLLLARLAAQAGQRDEAVQILERAIERGSDAPQLRQRLAELQRRY